MTYGCHNRQRPSAASVYPAQDGWFYDESGMTRHPKIIQVAHVMSQACMYDKSDTDAACGGCAHQKGQAPIPLQAAAAQPD